MLTTAVADLRKEYTLRGFDPAQAHPDPLIQFRQWFEEAVGARLPEPNALHLATASAEGRPSGRIVLLKGLDERGLVFYTNYESRKGLELNERPFAAATFFWAELERQVRLEGQVEKISAVESDAYFESRPRGSQLGAWVSSQSRVIPNRETLEDLNQAVTQRFEEQSVPRPPHWGGFRLSPSRLEFWQGRPSRLHDRILYTREMNGNWVINRLAP